MSNAPQLTRVPSPAPAGGEHASARPRTGPAGRLRRVRRLGNRPPRGAAALAAAVLLAVAGLAACSPGYVLRAAWEEGRILDARRPIRAVVRDTATPPGLRDRLRLVLTARDYAGRVLGLDPGESFTSYAELPRDTLVLVVSASPPYRLAWKTWWFPVVGDLPYKGYFDFGEARRKARELERRGYDTYVRPAAAFSTLGWLPDPLPSPALDTDSVGIVQMVLHEVTHTTYFPGGHPDFGESFATFVGHAGAISFFCEGLRREAPCAEARARWSDARRFGRWLTGLHDRLSALYARDLPREETRRRKEEAMAAARRSYREDVLPAYEGDRVPSGPPGEVNNAWVLSRVLYYRRLDDFERVRRRGAGLHGTLEAILRRARRASSPWEGLDRLLAEPAGGDEGPASGLRRPSPSAP